ncbi:lysosomal aspartic protease isoform X2 [Leptinotarsa decemlineata]|uniref:lysosomal aspartic protease isoform X2 n=1 Tax=Leptinotarsa decemlineata TaxID=7539 RepID=UPI003D306799
MKRIFILLITVLVTYCYKEKHGTIRVDLFRQTNPHLQYLVYGTHLNWFKKNDSYPDVPIYRYSDNEFYGKIMVGKPGQMMNVAFDTAWSQTWLISSKCSAITTPGCMFHNYYYHEKSSSYKKDGRPFSADMGNFNMTGFYSYDTISVDSANVTTFSFVEMSTVPTTFILNKADGAIGLGTKYGDSEPFFYALYRQKKVRDPIFSIYLNSSAQGENAGSLMLGFVDEKLIHRSQYPNKSILPDEIKYLSVDEGILWKFSVDRIVVTPNATTPTINITLCNKGCKAISDTSSNEIFGPVDEVNKILALINAKAFFGKWTVNCDTIDKLPRIDFILGGQRFSLEGSQYIKKISIFHIKLCVSAFTATQYSSDKELWILGGAFLSQYYSIYNIQNKTIGLVKAI